MIEIIRTAIKDEILASIDDAQREWPGSGYWPKRWAEENTENGNWYYCKIYPATISKIKMNDGQRLCNIARCKNETGINW